MNDQTTNGSCEHWKRCGDCHSPALVTGLRVVEDDLRAECDRLRGMVDTMLATHDDVERRAEAAEAETERLRFALAAICFLAPNTEQGNMAAAALADPPRPTSARKADP